MPPPRIPPSLVAELESIPGLRAREGEPLAGRTTLKIGGPAQLLVEADRESAVASLMRRAHGAGLRVELLGLGSNVLVPDEGLGGAVLRLVGELKRIRMRGVRVSAGAGAALPHVARRTARAGLAGLEALSGFPSTVGGGVFMNAGCYGTEIRDVLRSVRVVERTGERRRLAVDDLEPAYRRTNLRTTGAIVVRALFDLAPGDPEALERRIEELNAKRWASLPSGVPNAGSIFRNPPGDSAGRLLELCEMKGERSGAAEVSERHANVIVNRGGASADSVVDLMLEGRRRVLERFGVELEPELILLGGLARRWRDAIRTG